MLDRFLLLFILTFITIIAIVLVSIFIKYSNRQLIIASLVCSILYLLFAIVIVAIETITLTIPYLFTELISEINSSRFHSRRHTIRVCFVLLSMLASILLPIFVVRFNKMNKFKSITHFLLIAFLVIIYWLGLFSLFETLVGRGDDWGAFAFVHAFIVPSIFVTIAYIITVVIVMIVKYIRQRNKNT